MEEWAISARVRGTICFCVSLQVRRRYDGEVLACRHRLEDGRNVKLFGNEENEKGFGLNALSWRTDVQNRHYGNEGIPANFVPKG